MFSSTLHSRFAPPVARNLTPKGREEYDEQSATMSTPLPERFIGQDFSVFHVLITKMSPDFFFFVFVPS